MKTEFHDIDAILLASYHQERRMEEYELGVEALKKERSTLREELRKTKEKLIMMESVIKTMRAGGSGGEGESMEDSPAYKHRVETLAKQVEQQHVK